MEEADHFSSLPDNIITQIFSYLTMKEALAICISCKKLMHLWTTIPHLEFKESVDVSFNLLVDAKKRNLVKVIDRFFKYHDHPIETFQLSFYPEWYSEDVFSWIGLVMQRGLIELDLNFLSNLGVRIQLPSSLLNSKTLQILRLSSCVLESHLGFSGLSSLKSLFLRDVILSDDMIQALLCQNGLLQTLSLQNCKGFQSIIVTDINAKLNYLSLENCCGLDYLFAPQVRALSICTEKINVFVIEVSHITDVMFLHKSLVNLSSREAFRRTWRVLENVKFPADEEAGLHMNLDYQGVAKLEFKTYSCQLRELCGHCWLLRNACMDKVVLSMIESEAVQ